jgi:hypothetical protein
MRNENLDKRTLVLDKSPFSVSVNLTKYFVLSCLQRVCNYVKAMPLGHCDDGDVKKGGEVESIASTTARLEYPAQRHGSR